MKRFFVGFGVAMALCLAAPAIAWADQAAAAQRPGTNGASATVPSGVAVPPGYVIGTEDLLTVVFWRDRDMSGDVVVRPDGKISLPLLNDMQAAGYTPEQLKKALEEAASKYVAEPNVTVVVREIRSRKFYVVGNVSRPGTYPLTSEMNVLQAIAVAGGFLEYANEENVTIIRMENGKERRFKFNYKDVVKGKKVQQNLALKPGDTIVVR